MNKMNKQNNMEVFEYSDHTYVEYAGYQATSAKAALIECVRYLTKNRIDILKRIPDGLINPVLNEDGYKRTRKDYEIFCADNILRITSENWGEPNNSKVEFFLAKKAPKSVKKPAKRNMKKIDISDLLALDMDMMVTDVYTENSNGMHHKNGMEVSVKNGIVTMKIVGYGFHAVLDRLKDIDIDFFNKIKAYNYIPDDGDKLPTAKANILGGGLFRFNNEDTVSLSYPVEYFDR